MNCTHYLWLTCFAFSKYRWICVCRCICLYFNTFNYPTIANTYAIFDAKTLQLYVHFRIECPHRSECIIYDPSIFITITFIEVMADLWYFIIDIESFDGDWDLHFCILAIRWSMHCIHQSIDAQNVQIAWNRLEIAKHFQRKFSVEYSKYCANMFN